VLVLVLVLVVGVGVVAVVIAGVCDQFGVNWIVRLAGVVLCAGETSVSVLA
jgi:hypothetical protein